MTILHGFTSGDDQLVQTRVGQTGIDDQSFAARFTKETEGLDKNNVSLDTVSGDRLLLVVDQVGFGPDLRGQDAVQVRADAQT